MHVSCTGPALSPESARRRAEQAANELTAVTAAAGGGGGGGAWRGAGLGLGGAGPGSLLVTNALGTGVTLLTDDSERQSVTDVPPDAECAAVSLAVGSSSGSSSHGSSSGKGGISSGRLQALAAAVALRRQPRMTLAAPAVALYVDVLQLLGAAAAGGATAAGAAAAAATAAAAVPAWLARELGKGGGEGGAAGGGGYLVGVRVNGPAAEGLPESEWGMVTRAVLQPPPPPPDGSPASSTSAVALPAWRERFLFKLPADLSAALLLPPYLGGSGSGVGGGSSTGYHAFAGVPVQLDVSLLVSEGAGGGAPRVVAAGTYPLPYDWLLNQVQRLLRGSSTSGGSSTGGGGGSSNAGGPGGPGPVSHVQLFPTGATSAVSLSFSGGTSGGGAGSSVEPCGLQLQVTLDERQVSGCGGSGSAGMPRARDAAHRGTPRFLGLFRQAELPPAFLLILTNVCMCACVLVRVCAWAPGGRCRWRPAGSPTSHPVRQRPAATTCYCCRRHP